MSGKVSKGNAKVSTTRKFRHYLPGSEKGAYLPVNCLGIRYVGTIGPDHLESIILKIIGKKSIILLVIYNLLFQKIIDFLPIIQANNRQNINYFLKINDCIY